MRESQRDSAWNGMTTQVAVPVSADTIRSHPAFETEVQREVELRTMRQRLADYETLQSQPPQAQYLRSTHQNQGNMADFQANKDTDKHEWAAERDRLTKRLREEEMASRDLRAEVNSLRTQTQDQSKSAPTLAMLQVRISFD